MRIQSIRFRNVGPFGADGIRLDGFTPGLNVVCETNEFGKSSILDALQLILYRPFSSTKADVKNRMHTASTDGFEGEIYFEVDAREYCFWKRFIKRKGARLLDVKTGETLAVDRSAEERLATLLRADFSEKGPSGLLWVKQGYSMEEVSDDGQIASRLENELGTLIGGDRARTYLTRVETELADDLTPSGQEKKGGPLRKARETVAAIESELSDAVRLRDTTTSIGEELRRVISEMTQLSKEADTDKFTQQINEARRAMTAAQQFANSLELKDAQKAEAEAAAQRAAERQADHISALVSYNDARKQLAASKDKYQLETESLADLEKRRVDIRKTLSENEAQIDELERLRTRRERFKRNTQRLEGLQKDMQHLGARLEQYKSLESQQSKLTDQISDLPVLTRADVERLRGAADEVRHCEMALAALSTHLYLDLSERGEGKVKLSGRDLKSGPIELPGGAALKIEGIGEIRSDDSQLRPAQRNLELARQTHQELLDRLSVTGIAEASKFADLRHDLEEDRKRITSEMARLTPEGLSAIETEFNFAEEEARELAEGIEGAHNEQEKACDENVVETLRADRAKLDVVEDALIAARQKQAKTETEQARLRERLTGLNLPKDASARTAHADMLAGEKLKADAKLRAITAEVDALKSEAPEQSVDILEARLKRLEQAQELTRQKLETLKTKAAGLQARRDAAFEGGDADAIVASLTARLETEKDRLAKRVRNKDVRILLRDTLIETQTRLREAYTAPVSQELTPLLSRVFPGAQAELGDSLGVNSVIRRGKMEKIAQLSGGTQEQFAILTRLAYARLLARSGASAPVILDDALVYADDARRDAMFDVLGMVSAGPTPIQIIYLSCHAGATLHLGGYRITPRPWTLAGGTG